MSTYMPHGGLVLLAALAASGVLLGRCYFAMLRWSAARYATGRLSAARGLLLALARIVCAAAFFALTARLGALTLLAAFLGFIAARAWALRNAREST